jgi:hypothetical protein
MMAWFREFNLKISCDVSCLASVTRNSGRFAEACGPVDITSNTDDIEAQIEKFI